MTDHTLGSIPLTEDEADIVLDALQHYLGTVMVPMVDTVDPEYREGYIEDNHTMEVIISRVEMLIDKI
jgi:hypothetical protein